LTTAFRVDDEWTTVVKGISFEIGQRETVAIVGESGSGKSVTALSIMGLLPAANSRATGEILLEGRDLLKLPENQMRHVRGNLISMIFQEPMTSLNPVLTLGFQIAETLIYHRGLDRAQAEAETLRILERVRIPSAASRLHEYPHRLSGGMRQRVMIAMALACKPKLLIADEPTTALDVTIQAQILDLLRELVTEEDAALILITHDLGVVAGMCERVNVMYGGMFMETGSAEQLFGSPRHPYTLGLLQSVPRLDAGHRARLHPIEGSPPDMLRPPAACPFQPRCRFEVDESRRSVPSLVEVERGHKVACFNPVPAEEWQREREAATA
jgi:oligopeptide transport system ATP-binding protein